MSRHIPYHTSAEPPIYIRQRRVRRVPNWNSMGIMLVIIAFWWIIAFLVFR